MAHADYARRQLESNILDHFIDGLKSDIRKFVLSVGLPNNLNDCLEKAKNVENANLEEPNDIVVNSVRESWKSSVPKQFQNFKRDHFRSKSPHETSTESEKE